MFVAISKGVQTLCLSKYRHFYSHVDTCQLLYWYSSAGLDLSIMFLKHNIQIKGRNTFRPPGLKLA